MVLAIIDGVLTYQDEKSKIDISALSGLVLCPYNGDVYYHDGSNIVKHSDNSIVHEGVQYTSKFRLYQNKYKIAEDNNFTCIMNNKIIKKPTNDFDTFCNLLVCVKPISIENRHILPVNIGLNSFHFDALFEGDKLLFKKDEFRYYSYSDKFIYGWYFVFRNIKVCLSGDVPKKFYKKYKNKRILDYEVDDFMNVRIVYKNAEFVWLRTNDTYELMKGENVEFYYPSEKIKSARNI